MAKLKENSTILKSTGEEIIATEESVDRKLLLKADKDDLDEHKNDNTSHITSTERNTWNAKETPSGAQAKADTAEANAKAYTDQEVGEVAQELAAHKNENATGAHKAKNIAIEDAGGHFTATDVEGALNELFTNVSNGKDLIGRAITDVDPNVVIPTEPTFEELASAIGEISTGKKWATGNISNYQAGNPVVVSGLDFRPYTIIVVHDNLKGLHTVYSWVISAFNNSILRRWRARGGNLDWIASSGIHWYESSADGLVIRYNGFTINGGFSQSGAIQWIAFEE